jgi:hypothetical protein
VAVEGDLVTIHFTAKDPDGAVIESTRTEDGPLTFEIGAGEVMGNPLFKVRPRAGRGRAGGRAALLCCSRSQSTQVACGYMFCACSLRPAYRRPSPPKNPGL